MSDIPNNEKSAEQNASLTPSFESFSKQVDNVLNGKADRYNDLFVCHTPKVLTDLGFAQLPMLYTKKHLRDALHEKRAKGTGKTSLSRFNSKTDKKAPRPFERACNGFSLKNRKGQHCYCNK